MATTTMELAAPEMDDSGGAASSHSPADVGLLPQHLLEEITKEDMQEIANLLKGLVSTVENKAEAASRQAEAEEKARPKDVKLDEMHKALQASFKIFKSDFDWRTSEVAVKLANVVDLVVDRNTVWPVNLSGGSDRLGFDFKTYLFDADPVKIHLDEMVEKVGIRIETERRAVCLNVIDSCISKIKRSLLDEPAFVVRIVRNKKAQEAGKERRAMEAANVLRARNDRIQARRASVRAGEFLPPLQSIDIRPPVTEHLAYITWFVADKLCLEKFLLELPPTRENELSALKMKLDSERAKAIEVLKKAHKELRQTKATAAADSIKSKRDLELASKKASYQRQQPPTEMPRSEADEFNRGTSAAIEEAKQKVEEQGKKEEEAALESLKAQKDREKEKAISSLETSFALQERTMRSKLSQLESTLPAHVPTDRYAYPTVNMMTTTKSLPPLLPLPSNVRHSCVDNTRWPTFFKTLQERKFGTLADALLMYFDTDSLKRAACVCREFAGFTHLQKVRRHYAIVVQTLCRRHDAQKQLHHLRLRYQSAVVFQKYNRGAEGRRKAAAHKRKILQDAALRDRFGAGSSVVRVFVDGSGTPEAFISATEALIAVNKTRGGTSLLHSTFATDMCVTKLNDAFLNAEDLSRDLKRNMLVKKTKGGKSEWVTIVKFIGQLEINSDLRCLVEEKQAGESMLNMMRRGDSVVKEEGKWW